MHDTGAKRTMGKGFKFDIKKLDKLKDPLRLESMNPEKLWEVVGPQTGAEHKDVEDVVDIGAGIGFYALPFAKHIKGTVYACDISEEMLSHLEVAVEEAKLNNVKAVHSEEVNVPLSDGIADLVLMANLHHELDFPENSLKECLRLLRPGGRLAIMDWKPIETEKGPPVHIRIPEPEVIKQLSDAGYEKIEEHDIFPFHYVITSLKTETV